MPVSFRDIDSWGMMWHGHYLSYIDQARIQLMNQVNLSFSTLKTEGYYMPVTHLEIDYKNAARVEDLLSIKIAMLKQKNSFINTYFRIYRQTGAPLSNEQLLVQGYTEQVIITKEGQLMYHIPKSIQSYFDRLHALAIPKKDPLSN